VSKTYATLGELKTGNFIMIDGEPCKIVSISKAKTGKHGSAKANVVAISLLTGAKKTFVAPVDTRVEVPIVEKRVGQVLAVTDDSIQLMDMESYDTFEVPIPEDEDLKNKIEPGVEVEYWVLPPGVYKIMRIRGGSK